MLKPLLETERLILREIVSADEEALFEMDADPEVHRFLGNKPVENKEQVKEVIKMIQQQYKDNGIARWAVINKNSNEFMGWCGLKLYKQKINGHINFYELGYRFNKKHWGKGYATESGKACVNYGFEALNLKEIYGMTDSRNLNSNKVLLKLGFKYIEKFDFEGDESDWFKLTRNDWNNKLKN
ncbi:MAG: GNAT family N-acetyltransferase [Bacteroidetes bacterium]|nr:GNAT family N-acetyltransferase [Bacteroidota bacterium]